MLSRSRRLSGNQVKTLPSAKTKVFRVPLFMIRVLDRKDASPARFAVIVSKKVAKGAVVRNLLRRRLYSVVMKSSLPVGADYIVSVQQKATFAQYQEGINTIIKQLGA